MRKQTLISFLLSVFCIYLISYSAAYAYDNSPHLCSLSKIRQYSAKNLFDNFDPDYPGDSTIDVTYYKLDLKITNTPDLLDGKVTVNAVSLRSSLNSFFLDFEDNMIVDSVTSGTKTVSHSQSDDKLNITLNGSILLNQGFSVTVYYHGVPDAVGFGSFVFGANQNTPAVWTLSEPYGAKTWFPNKDNPSDKADSSDVWITVTENLTGVSNGVLEEEINNGDGTKTYKWKSRYPIAPYLISLAIAEYAVHTNYYRYSPSDSMLVIDYIYPQNLSSIESLLDETPRMLEVLSDIFGEYPFLNEKYGHAEFGVLAGMEHQTISSMGTFFVNIMTHELTHQWFGDKITCADWEDIWLNEGFAVYGEALYIQRVQGQSEYDSFISGNMSSAKNARGSIYVQDINSVAEIFDGNRTYAKGGVVVHMLRGVMGDADFFATLKAYMSDTSFAYGSANISDFQNVAETVSGKDLTYFFGEWLYGENYPRYTVDWVFNQQSGIFYNVSITIKQNVNSNPAFFTMPVNMKINTSEGDTLVTVWNNAQEQTFDFTVAGKPSSLDFDPDNYILKDVSGNIFNVPVSYALEQNYPNPFNPVTTITYELGNVSQVKLTVYDLLGREAAVLVNSKQREGRYTVDFDSGALASGIYFYKLEAENTTPGSGQTFTGVKRMVLVK